jgi:hypothetical protein
MLNSTSGGIGFSSQSKAPYQLSGGVLFVFSIKNHILLRGPSSNPDISLHLVKLIYAPNQSPPKYYCNPLSKFSSKSAFFCF